MILRYCGDLTIGLLYRGRTDDNRPEYRGCIRLPDGRTWRFNHLCGGCDLPGTRPEDYDRLATDAVGFATYWTSLNRGDDTPEWAPAGDLADAFDEAADLGDSDYIVRRTRAISEDSAAGA